MYIYIIVATILFLGIFTKSKLQKVYYRGSLLCLFLFTSLRNINLGGYDTENYQRIFYFETPNISNMLNYNGDYEYAYIFLNSFVKSILEDYRFYQIVYSLLAIILLSLIIKKLKLKKYEQNLFLFIYFCYQYLWNNFVLLRQNLAVLIIWLVLITLYQEKVKSYISVFFSSFLHRTSILNIMGLSVIYFFRNIKKSKAVLITLLISLFLFALPINVYQEIINFVINIIGSRYQVYALSNESIVSINYINYILRWIIVLLFYVNYEKINTPHKEKMFYISLIVMLLSSVRLGFVGRFVEYYMISIYFIAVINHQAYTGIKKYIYLFSVYCVFLAILVRFLYTFSNGELLNYSLF